MKIMAREDKRDKHLTLLLLDTYNPKTDALEYLDCSRPRPVSRFGKYHHIRNNSKAHHVKPLSAEHYRLSTLASAQGAVVTFVDVFRNPNRTTQISKR